MSTTALLQQTAIDSAVRYLVTNYSPKGNKVGWLMMASILVEAWDLYSIAFVLIFIREQFNPDPLMLGLAAAGTQGGALIGALIGGWLISPLIGGGTINQGDFSVMGLVSSLIGAIILLAVVNLVRRGRPT